jgi:hypothetical protein
LKNNVINTPIYQNSIKPLVRDVVNSTVKPLVDKYAGRLGGAANQGIDALGSASGAYGLRPYKTKSGAVKKRKAAPKKRIHHMAHMTHHIPVEEREYFDILAPSPIMPRPVKEAVHF